MSYKDPGKNDSLIIDCGEVMDIANAAEFRTQLLLALESGQPIVLDAGRVERVDTAALQLLSALFQDANTQSTSVTWESPSESLRDSAAQLGLSGMINL